MLIGDLRFDESVYPRSGINFTHVQDLVNASLAGCAFPPIIIDRASKRVVDGVHRYTAYKKLYGANHDTAVDERDYADETELWLAAVAANSDHGLNYTAYERTRILVEGERRGITRAQVATLIHLPVELAEKKIETRTGFVKVPAGGKERVALRSSMKELGL